MEITRLLELALANSVSGQYSTVVAGDSNSASSDYGFIGAGISNSLIGTHSVICGGNA